MLTRRISWQMGAPVKRTTLTRTCKWGFFACSVFLAADFPDDVRSELTNPIGRSPKPGLGDNAAIALIDKVMAGRLPSSRYCASAKCAAVECNLWAQVAFSSVIGYEISLHCVSCPAPEAFASATIIPGLVTQNTVSQRDKRVLDDKLRLPGPYSSQVPAEIVSPSRWTVVDLVSNGKQYGFDVYARRCKGLSSVKPKSLIICESLELGIFWDVSSVEPINT
jgi:hypothetical protein